MTAFTSSQAISVPDKPFSNVGPRIVLNTAGKKCRTVGKPDFVTKTCFMDQERQFKRYVLVASEITKASIEENPLVNKTTRQFALEANINRKKLQAAFKDLTGMGIREYLLSQRMKRARQLLHAGTIPIKEIAIICRYKSQRAFTSAFKRSFGLTPTEYQNLPSL